MKPPEQERDDEREQLRFAAIEIEQRFDSGSTSDSRESYSLDQFSEREKQELQEFAQGLQFLRQVRSEKRMQDTPVRKGDETLRNKAISSDQAKRNRGTSEGIRTVGRFRIKEQIGQGGFAKVFLAHDPFLDRDVAIKIPKPAVLLSDDARARFAREAKSAALLSHPAIIPAFDSGRFGTIDYIVYEYCPGPTLADWFEHQDHLIDFPSAARIINVLAEAVEHAHQRGVIHRDLKPANVLIDLNRVTNSEDMISQLRITDFGLSKHLDLSDDYQTVDGAVIGTPAYMSPEQAQGGKNIGPASDVFSLGIIFYELLSKGVLPFKRETHLATLRALETEPLPKLRKHRPDVPKDLIAICEKCLQKDIAHRYPSAFDLAEDLQRWSQGRTIKARPSSAIERLVRWRRRRPKLAAALIFAFMSLALGFGLTTWQWQQSQHHLAISNIQRDRAQTNVDELHGAVERILAHYNEKLEIDGFLDESHQQVVNEMLAVHKRLIDDEAKHLDVTESMIDSYCQIAKLYRLMGEMDRGLEVINQARSMLMIATQDSAERRKQLQPACVDLYMAEIYIRLEQGNDNVERIAWFNDTLVPMMKSCESVQTKQAAKKRWFLINRHIALTYLAIDKDKHARVYYEKSLHDATELLAMDPNNEDYIKSFGISLQDMATVLHVLGHRKHSSDYFEKALSHFLEMENDERFESDMRYRIGFIRSELAHDYRIMKRHDEAVKQFDLAEKIFLELIAEQPLHARALSRLTQVCYRKFSFHRSRGEFDKAIQVCDQGMTRAANMSEMRMKDYYNVSFPLLKAQTLLDHFEGRADEAEKLLKQGIDAGEAALIGRPADHGLRPKLAEGYRRLGLIHKNRNEMDTAVMMARRSYFHATLAYRALPDSNDRRQEMIVRGQYVAYLAGNAKRYDEARRVLVQLSEASPQSWDSQYKVGRYFSRLAKQHRLAESNPSVIAEAKESSIQYLHKAIRLGFNDKQRIVKDADWNELRDDEEFVEIVNSLSLETTH